MYSYEDRIRAVKVYIVLGKRMSVALRQLGYPTKNALKSWCRENEQQHDLPTGYVRTKPTYSDDQKLAAVELSTSEEVSPKGDADKNLDYQKEVVHVLI